ncbi:MAG TPA: LacI family DNA-binding transcriptional regulator [Myxococcaceae bacterium]|nr:LacI family DNA-binding transcriptional regulator [Myxococcaceae bacterium]
MAPSRVTLREVARRAGVHPSTVSRVLNAGTRHMITEEIAKRVTEAADALSYQPNPIASGLKTNRSRIVGVLIPDITNPVFPPMIRAIEDAFAEVGYTAILANTDNDETRERAILRNMMARRVDGLIMATARRRDPLVEQCLVQEIPVVLLNRTVDSGEVSWIITDDGYGIELAVEHMVQCGHTRIAHVAGPLSLSTGLSRYRGFLKALETARLKADPRRIVVCHAFSEEEGRRAFLALWEKDRTFTAVVTANDLLALGCYDALAQLGVRVPAEIAVSGFNDMRFADKLRPPLTTVRIPHYKMGAQAARTLLARLNNREAPIEHIRFKPELIVRGSTARAHPRADNQSRPSRIALRRRKKAAEYAPSNAR